MNYFRIATAIFVMSIAMQAHAQIDKGEIKVYDNNDSTKKVLAKQDVNPSSLETMMKFNPFLLLEGNFPVYIERQINKHISIEAAPGITFRDLEVDVAQGQDTTSFTKLFYYPLPYASGYKAGLGYSFKVDGRYYFGNNMMDGMYLSPQIDYRHYVLNYPNVDVYGNSSGTYSSGYTNTVNFIISWGIETDDLLPWGYFNGDYSGNNLAVSNNNNSIYIDYSVGFGMKLITGEQGVTTSNIINGIPAYSNSLVPFSAWNPMIYLDIKFGFDL